MNNILALEKNCCGCGGCKDICPKNSISFESDKEGFLYPVVNESCVDCGLCLCHCPVARAVEKPQLQQVYGARIKDENLLLNSSSGGIFSAFALEILGQNGVVFGCAYEDNFTVKHIFVEKPEDLHKLQGSKYVQSNTLGVFKKVEEFLEKDRSVLFSGTPCQVAGLKAFLKKPYDRLFTVDIVCHGVPSQKLFDNYIKYLERKEESKISQYNFRSKNANGWGLYYEYKGENIKGGDGFFDPYYYSFLMGKSYRESCYKCKFANENRQGDISLADFWGVNNLHPKFYNKKGNSGVIINSEKGEKYWEKIKGNLEYIKTDYKTLALNNSNLLSPSHRPESRDDFYKDMEDSAYFEKKLKPPFQLKRRVKSLVPEGAKRLIKKVLHKA